ncbi:hypothetical protein ACFSYG_05185 [Leeuwenhoekiella polynyae]|uniref:Uncharacterized protein n=1 Tax=Leeuwenhoekiella polynyae TaxID=1550906 RepID=A0A4Q0P1M6_9FLAO|nr:hypothetical protein [Leeuwenhoekiella polynyae]RXG20141.1 hypothetical protein DSM02_2793 [Leeuwenhoekiella polynyae]
MKISFYLLLILLLSLSSCKEKQEVVADPREATDTLQIAYQPNKKQEIILTPSAKNATESWENYLELAAQIDALDTVRVGYLRVNGKDWISNASLAQTKVKDSFANTAIESRLTVLFTKTNTLIQEASKLEVDTAAVNKEATELYNTFQNLKLQINLKHQKSIEELLEQYEVEADSLSAVKDSPETRRDSLLRANNVPVQN